jgi:hypothetical protein
VIECREQPFTRREIHMPLDYARQQLPSAVANLAKSTETLQARVASAYNLHVIRYGYLLEAVHLLPPYRVQIQRRVLRALGFRATVDKTADGLLDVVVELQLAAGQPGTWFTTENTQLLAHAGEHNSPTGLCASVSEREVKDLLQSRASALPDLRVQAQAAAQDGDGRETAPAGRVRFLPLRRGRKPHGCSRPAGGSH